MKGKWAIPIIVSIAVMMVFSSIPSYAVANSDNASDKAKFKIPAHAVKIAEGVYSLGKAKDVDGKAVEGFMFVHPKDEPAKPDKPDKPGKGGGGKKGGGGPDCWAFIAKSTKWENTEKYVLDTSNGDSLSLGIAGFVATTISTSLETWDGQVGFNIFDTRDTSKTVDGVDTASPDGKNEVFFGDIDEPNVIASTTIWRTIGPPQARHFVEWDMIFNDPVFIWGDAVGNPTFMDLQNIATHEIGHAAGMAHPDDSCTDETMFKFSKIGETKKRDLTSDGDIAGIKKLYG